MTLFVDQQPLDGVNLHMGLQSPSSWRVAAIVDRTAKVYEAAIELVEARFTFDGQSPYSPDIVLVNEFCLDMFLAAVAEYGAKYMQGRTRQLKSETASRGGNQQSISQEVEADNGAQVIVSGTDWGIVHLHNR